MNAEPLLPYTVDLFCILMTEIGTAGVLFFVAVTFCPCVHSLRRASTLRSAIKNMMPAPSRKMITLNILFSLIFSAAAFPHRCAKAAS